MERTGGNSLSASCCWTVLSIVDQSKSHHYQEGFFNIETPKNYNFHFMDNTERDRGKEDLRRPVN